MLFAMDTDAFLAMGPPGVSGFNTPKIVIITVW